MEVLCQLPYLAVQQRLFILQNASSEWNFGGRRINIQDPSVVRRVEIVGIYTLAKNNDSVRASLFEKVFVVKRYSLNCHPWFWPIWLDGFSRRSPRNALRFVACHDFHLCFSRYRANIAMSKGIHRSENSIYSVNTRKTDTKASILLSSELAEVA